MHVAYWFTTSPIIELWSQALLSLAWSATWTCAWPPSLLNRCHLPPCRCWALSVVPARRPSLPSMTCQSDDDRKLLSSQSLSNTELLNSCWHQPVLLFSTLVSNQLHLNLCNKFCKIFGLCKWWPTDFWVYCVYLCNIITSERTGPTWLTPCPGTGLLSPSL